MNYQAWLPLFGLAATDSKIVSMLAAHGVTTPITLAPQVFATGVDFKPLGFGLGFTSEFTLRGGAADLPVLSSVVIVVAQGKKSKGWVPCTSPLPSGLSTSDGKDDVVAKLGPPHSSDDFFCSAGWTVDGLNLAISFTDDWSQIKQLGLSLPGAR